MALEIPILNLPTELKPTHETPAQLRAPQVVDGITEYRDIEYVFHIGYRPLHMDVYVPANAVNPPVIIYIHGGGFLFGTRHKNVVSAPTWADFFKNGFAIAAIEYRLAGEAPFPANLHDVTAAIRWVRKYQDFLKVNASKLAVFGESAGGYLATFAGMNLTDPNLIGTEGEQADSTVQAVVAWSPVTDVLGMDVNLKDAPIKEQEGSPNAMNIGVAVNQDPQKAIQASPITHANPKAAPMLILQGEADEMVSLEQGEALKEKLGAQNVHVELHNYPGAPHIFFGIDCQEQRDTSVEFLKRILKA